MNWKFSCYPSFLLVFLCLCGMGLPVDQLIGQGRHKFKSFGQEDGLSSNSIRVLLEDQQGFIWVGSDNGLDRFDGRNFLNFRFDPKNAKSLNANRVNSLALDGVGRLWAGTSNGLCYLDLNTGLIERVAIGDSKTGMEGYDIKNIWIDSSENIWAGTLSNGLLKLSPNPNGEGYSRKQFIPDDQNGTGLSHATVDGLLQVDREYLWIGTGRGVDRLHLPSETFAFVPVSLPKSNVGAVAKIFEDQAGHIVYSVHNAGVFFLDPKVSPLTPKPYLGVNISDALPLSQTYRHTIQDRQGRLWVGTRGGVYLVDSIKENYEYLRYSSKKAAAVRCLLESHDGTVWVGFNTAGMSRKSRITSNYIRFQYNVEEPNSPSKGQIRTMTEDQQGNLWVGYLNEGLDQFRWDEQRQSLVKLKHLENDPAQQNGLLSNNIIQIIADSKGFLWIATNGAGLNKLDPVSGKIESYVHDPQNSSTLSGNRIWGLSEDQNGDIWVGEFTTGLNRLDPQTGVVKRFPYDPNKLNSLSHNRVKTIFVDSHGDLWIGTNAGLNRLDVETEQFTHYLHDPQDTNSLSNNLIWSIYEDIDHNLWVGTSLGLNKLTGAVGQHSSGLRIERMYETDGLPSNTILGIQGNDQGQIWVSADNGVAQLIETEDGRHFQALDNEEGLEHAFYPSKAHYYSQQHQHFYFGTREDGLLVVSSLQNQAVRTTGKLLISRVSKYRDEEGKGEELVDDFINSRRKGELTHKDRILTIQLSEINWNKNSRFEYLLKGFDSNWRELPNDMELTYTDLAAGRYTLLGRPLVSEREAVEGQVLLQLRVYPPWWKTTWAYGLYLLAILGAIYGLYQFQLKQELKKQEMDNLRALDRFKNQLYTNITHEFKTPLTVIGGIIEQVKGNEKIKRVVRRNSKNLLDLVNQILDLRKLELGKVKLDWVQADVVPYFQYILESYGNLAEIKGVNLHYIPSQQQILMDIDKEKLLRILTNLLSNAIKFTPEGGDVYLRVEEARLIHTNQGSIRALKFVVRDTGVGIPVEDQAFIFDRFYQVEPDGSKYDKTEEPFHYHGLRWGSGIGLALTKDLVGLLEGEISLDSEERRGTSFTVRLPLRQTAPIEDMQNLEIVIPNIPSNDSEEEEQDFEASAIGQGSSGLQLLIVEDNDDVRDYLVFLLEDQYELYLAKDGQEGIDKALEMIPDIIVSDVMMPRKNGFQLLSELKTDIRTSHIPIVILTAKDNVEARVEGLKRGADAYLAKPFNHEELFTRLAKLHELRQVLRERYINFVDLEPAPAEDVVFAQEDAFMVSLREMVEEHMTDPEFGVAELCQAMGVSRSLLHRKLKVLANTSAANFIRAIRLHRATLLLKDQQVNISEIAYQVGFKDRSYFSRVFSKEFGISPRAYRDGD